MNIEWTLCSERMPKGLVRFIVRSDGRIYEYDKTSLNFLCMHDPDGMHEWTPYTQEKWEFLNR